MATDGDASASRGVQDAMPAVPTERQADTTLASRWVQDAMPAVPTER